MTELDNLRARFDGAVDWPDVPTDAALLTRVAGERRRRRRRGLQLAAAAVVVAAIATVPLALRSSNQESPGGNVASNPGQADDGLGVTSGHRAVGAMGLVFEVPADWGSEDLACDGSPAADTVAFGSGRDCLVSNPPRVSSLIITRNVNPRVTAVVNRVDIRPATYGDVSVNVSEPVLLDDLWTFVVADADETVAVFRSTDEGPARRAHELLREVPQGWVAVPPRLGNAEVRHRLVELGLEPRENLVDQPGQPRGTVVRLSPGPGSVLRVGSQVEITRVR